MVVQSLPLSFGGFPKQSASCPGESLLSFHRYYKKFDLIYTIMNVSKPLTRPRLWLQPLLCWRPAHTIKELAFCDL
jgi:hypothetical protein